MAAGRPVAVPLVGPVVVPLVMPCCWRVFLQLPTDQGVIDAAFMSSLAQNWPLKCYYRTLKTSIQVTLGSEKIPPKLVPQWRKEVFLTFRRLTSLVPEINYTYKMLGLSESNIKGSVADLTNGLSESQKVKLARYIATRLTIK